MANLSTNLSTPVVNASAAAANALWQRINTTYGELNRLLNDGARFVWKNPAGLTPQAAANEFGANAAALFGLSSLLCGLIGSITGTTPNPVPAGWTCTANGDGTMTLTQAG